MAGEVFPSEDQPNEALNQPEEQSTEQERRGFKHDPERVSKAGHKGGRKSAGNFNIETESEETD